MVGAGVPPSLLWDPTGGCGIGGGGGCLLSLPRDWMLGLGCQWWWYLSAWGVGVLWCPPSLTEGTFLAEVPQYPVPEVPNFHHHIVNVVEGPLEGDNKGPPFTSSWMVT